jgi:hypothetical protein
VPRPTEGEDTLSTTLLRWRAVGANQLVLSGLFHTIIAGMTRKPERKLSDPCVMLRG